MTRPAASRSAFETLTQWLNNPYAYGLERGVNTIDQARPHVEVLVRYAVPDSLRDTEPVHAAIAALKRMGMCRDE